MNNNLTSDINITKASYIASAVEPSQFPAEKLRQIAFIGRSNVGKSSLINSLMRVRNLARVSKQPGKTQTINFFRLTAKYSKGNSLQNTKDFYLVDLPGYGYAKTEQKNRSRWLAFTKMYFLYPQDLYCVCQLIDIRHAPMQSDVDMFNWLIAHEIPVFIIATKVDKIGKNVVQKNIAQIKNTLKVQELTILPYSSMKNEGRSSLLDFIGNALLE